MQKLSENELNIMAKIWEVGKPLYFDEILETVKEYNWADSTVRNFLARIIDKGYLKTEKVGRKNLYIPTVSEDYINKESKGLIQKLYDNSLKKFVAELYESDSVSLKDLVELREYLDEKIKEDE